MSGPGTQNAFLVKRTSGGGVRFSKDPLNLTNVHSRKVWIVMASIGRRNADYFLQQAGFVNDKVRLQVGGWDNGFISTGY